VVAGTDGIPDPRAIAAAAIGRMSESVESMRREREHALVKAGDASVCDAAVF
jgi:hypothetical protein